MSENLIHYSRKPLMAVHSKSQDKDGRKPQGLWVSVEGPDDWKSWCEGESFALDHLVHSHQIVLSQRANILRISDAAGIDALTREYSMPGRRFARKEMDWARLAERHDGIIIAPYIWERRIDGRADWYYSWDCASGCIWNARAVQGVIPLYSQADAVVVRGA